MKKVLFFSIFIFLIIFIFRLVIADTGFFFAYDYLKNKININNTSNQVSINSVSNQPSHDYSFKDIIGFKSKFDNLSTSFKPHPNQLIETDFWIRSNGGNFSNKYSNLNIININNIKNIALDFKINFNDKLFQNKWMNNVETNPIFFDGILFTVTPFKEIFAIEIETKKILWRFKSLKKINSRGISLWVNSETKHNSCIFVPIRNGLFCINYKTGKLNKNLGSTGFIKTGIVRAAPVIWKNQVLIATVDDQKVKSFDLNSGKLNFEIDIHPLNKKFKGGSPWGGISLDQKNDLLFLTTGNPRPALVGESRPGRNKNANSIIAIDLNKKDILWSFQEVIHDLWDYDIASPPLLTSIRINDELLDVVIVTTKIGNTLIFNRLTGEPFNDINYVNVPKSDFIYENASPKQIDLKIPEPLIRLTTSQNDLDDRSIHEKKIITHNIDDYKFGKFIPPSFEKNVLVYGLHGGAQWPGGVFNPYSQSLYVQVNQIPWLLKLFVSSNKKVPEKLIENFKIYKNKCSDCHQENRSGIYVTKDEKVIKYIPSLIKIFDNKYNELSHFKKIIKHKHTLNIKDKDLKKLHNLFSEWDNEILETKDYNVNFQWSQFLYEDNLPATKPPWGEIISLDLLSGKINWRVPNGYIEGEKIGTSNFGGLIATAGGLIFATGTEDKKIIALNSNTGEEVWSFKMIAAGSTAPITFKQNGIQYIAVIATGGRYHNYTKKYGELYVFSLK
jgi:quinoprotein glucose dehydrogenase